MLLAEIQGKLKGTFGCSICGADEAANPEAAAAGEDALTSTIFGALRWLRPELGLLPILRHLELPVPEPAVPVVRLWPWEAVGVVGVGDADPGDVGCEPDVVIDLPERALTLVEVKLGAALGADPLQLPKEAVFAYRHASGRPWRLLCITPAVTAPRIPGFCIEGGRLALAAPMPLADSVASYFAAAASLGFGAGVPSAAEARAAVRWLSWSSIGTVLETARTKAVVAPHEVALLDDVIALLRRRGLLRPVFHGFRKLPERRLAWAAGALWRHAQASHGLWNIEARGCAWPDLRWLSSADRSRSSFRGFGAMPAERPFSWPKLQWLAANRSKRR